MLIMNVRRTKRDSHALTCMCSRPGYPKQRTEIRLQLAQRERDVIL